MDEMGFARDKLLFDRGCDTGFSFPFISACNGFDEPWRFDFDGLVVGAIHGLRGMGDGNSDG